MLVRVYPDYIYKKKKQVKHKTKTKEIVLKKWKRFLDNNYFDKSYSKLSRNQQKKVKQYLKENVK